MEWFWDDVLNGNFFQTFCLTFVGLAAWFIYKRQIKDEVKNAAIIIKLEIDNIETSLNELKLLLESGKLDIYRSQPIYQTLEWFKLKNLLVGKLSIESIAAIDKFYKIAMKCEDARQIIKNNDNLNHIEKITSVHDKIEEISIKELSENPKYAEDELLQKVRESIKKYAKIYMNIGEGFYPTDARNHLNTSLNSSEHITNTPAYDEIKRVMNKGK